MNGVEFGKICRLCMSSKGSMRYIFQSDELEDDADSRPSLPLDVRIMLCSAVKVVRDDGLPSQACKQCLLMLDRWFEFKQKIESTDAILRKLVCQSADNYESQTYNIHQISDGTQTQGLIPSSFITVTTSSQHRPRPIQNEYCCTILPPLTTVIDPLQVVKIETKLHADANDGYYCDDPENPDEEVFYNDSEETEGQDNTSLDYRPTMSNEMLEPVNPAPKKKRKRPPGKPHHCVTCDKSFAQSGDLRIHARIHSGERPYICDACGKTFASSSNLARHKRIHAGLRPYLCSLCPKRFSVQSALREHENTHSGARPFLCQQCGRCFAQKGNLKIHEALHAGVKPYACHVCDKSFALRGNLKDHLNIHSCRRPFACGECPKSFTQRSTLKEHLKVHSGLKPFSCTACSKTFAYRKTLKIHLNTHTGEKPFVCEVCHKCFSERSHLKRHSNIHCSVRPSDETGSLPT